MFKAEISHLKLLHPEKTIVNSLTDFLFSAFEISWAHGPWERMAQMPGRSDPCTMWPAPGGQGPRWRACTEPRTLRIITNLLSLLARPSLFGASLEASESL